MTTSPMLFRLAQTPSRDEFLTIPTLEAIKPRFLLPGLEDHDFGPERLLTGLSDVFRHGHAGSPKGKEKARDEVLRTPVVNGEKEKGDGDVWQAVSEEGQAGPSRTTFLPLRSWDLKPVASQVDASPFLSEGSTFAFEAFITTSAPPLHLRKLRNTNASLPQDSKTLLDLMICSTLGTTTTRSLRWDAKQNRYVWDEQGGRPVAVERATAASSFGGFLSIGTAIRRLEIIIDTQSPIPLTPTHHALLHALSTYLTLIKQRLSHAIEECISESTAGWALWQSTLQDAKELCSTLCEVMYWPLQERDAEPLPSRASILLTHLHGHLLAHLSTAGTQQSKPIILALAWLLQRSSAPFLTLLQRWIGLSPEREEDEDPAHQPWSDLGITRTQKRSGEWEYSFSSRKMPGFIPKESRKTLFEAGRSLRLLREASGGQHPLCHGDWEVAADWGWGPSDVDLHDVDEDIQIHRRHVAREIEYWRRSVRNRTRPLSGTASFGRLRGPTKKERKRLPAEFWLPVASPVLSTTNILPPQEAPSMAMHGADEADMVDPIWALFDQEPGSHLSAAPANPLWAPTPLDDLLAFISHHTDQSHPLLPPQYPTLPLYISSYLLAPLIAHSNLVSTSLVSLYLDDLRLLDHLDVLRAFWLGGDVNFTERVSAALFGKDEAGAGEALGLGRRARTRVRLGLGGDVNEGVEGEWGIGLGLGLSERQKWPPGGAELAYALRTTLLSDDIKEVEEDSVRSGIEDRVSFAVMALPEDEKDGKRARWMDPQAIEALDFLYLAYSPPAAISSALPKSLMEKYQTIHNFILRLSRVETVLRTLYLDVNHQSDIFDEPIKSGVDARRPTQIHRQARGIFPKGSGIEHDLFTLRFRMNHFVTALGRYVLDIAIGIHWDGMRRRLERLKRRVPGDESEGGPASASASPATEGYFELEPEAEEGGSETTVNQLHSIDSLVVYHNVILDRILYSCLLSSHAGHQVTNKVLMRMLGLVLDLGKVVKEVERGLRGLEDGAERVKGIGREWREREGVFLHALERLSARSHLEVKDDVVGGSEHDLQILMGDLEEGELKRNGEKGSGDLEELLLRLRLCSGENVKRGRGKGS